MNATFETMPDDELKEIATMTLADSERQQMIDLINIHHERALLDDERARLDDLLKNYRLWLVRKAQALEAAVARGLVPPA